MKVNSLAIAAVASLSMGLSGAAVSAVGSSASTICLTPARYVRVTDSGVCKRWEIQLDTLPGVSTADIQDALSAIDEHLGALDTMVGESVSREDFDQLAVEVTGLSDRMSSLDILDDADFVDMLSLIRSDIDRKSDQSETDQLWTTTDDLWNTIALLYDVIDSKADEDQTDQSLQTLFGHIDDLTFELNLISQRMENVDAVNASLREELQAQVDQGLSEIFSLAAGIGSDLQAQLSLIEEDFTQRMEASLDGVQAQVDANALWAFDAVNALDADVQARLDGVAGAGDLAALASSVEASLADVQAQVDARALASDLVVTNSLVSLLADRVTALEQAVAAATSGPNFSSTPVGQTGATITIPLEEWMRMQEQLQLLTSAACATQTVDTSGAGALAALCGNEGAR